MAEEDNGQEQQQQAVDAAETAAPHFANCAGNLVQLPGVEGVTYNQYKCETCGQIVTVGHEELEANGMPPEHSPVPVPVVG